MKTYNLSPAANRLLDAIAHIQCGRRPTDVLAAHFGVTRQAVSRSVGELRKLGLICTRRGQIALAVARLEIHHHFNGDPCNTTCKLVEANVKNPNIGGLQQIAATFSSDNRKKRETREPSELIVGAYTALRRQIDPLFELGRGALPHLLGCENALRAARVPKTMWAAYIAWAFREFNQMTKGKLAFAPLDRLYSQTMIDRYCATLPARKFNAVKAKKMLREHGYTGSVTAALEVAVAMHDGTDIPDYSDAAQMAGAWLSERLEEVGTVEVQAP